MNDRKTSKSPINLLRGWPATALLPVEQLRKASEELLSDPSSCVPALQYGPDPGPEPLRQELSRWLGKTYGVAPDASRLCITGGASQNLGHILQRFTDPDYTHTIWMVAPCYHLACPIFADAGFSDKMRAVPEDTDGIDIAYLEHRLGLIDYRQLPTKPKYKGSGGCKIYRHIIYIVPTSSNPSGKTMPLKKRTELVQLARQHDALIVSDDVYDSLQWSVSPVGNSDGPQRQCTARPELLPRLCDIDRALGYSDIDPRHFGNTVSNGSFSKIIAPGVRTGWAEGTPTFAFELSQTGSTRSGGSPSQFAASVVWKLLEAGALDPHLDQVVLPSLKRRHMLMINAIERHIAPLGVEYLRSGPGGVYGGYFVWLSLPAAFDSASVAEIAKRDENLTLGHGRMFEVSGDEDSARFRNHVRLSFSWESEEAICEGVQRLGAVLRSEARRLGSH